VYGFAPSLCGLSKLAVSKHAVPMAVVAVVQAWQPGRVLKGQAYSLGGRRW